MAEGQGLLGKMGPFPMRLNTTSKALEMLISITEQSGELRQSNDDERPRKRTKVEDNVEGVEDIPLMIFDCVVAVDFQDGVKHSDFNVDSRIDSIVDIPLPVEWVDLLFSPEPSPVSSPSDMNSNAQSESLLKLIMKPGRGPHQELGIIIDGSDSASFPRLLEFVEVPLVLILDMQRNKLFQTFEATKSPLRMTTVVRHSPLPNHIDIRVKVAWMAGYSYLNSPKSAQSCIKRIWRDLFPAVAEAEQGAWVPQDFYENAHVPPSDQETWSVLDNPDDMDSTLYPFQKRTVQFMLGREGACLKGDRVITNSEPVSRKYNPLLWAKYLDALGDAIYVSRLMGTITRHPVDPSLDFRGGILSEEMGLGKTVELTALVSLHRRAIASPIMDVALEDGTIKSLSVTGATLIITPPHLLRQWQDELAFHAPKFRVYHYKGLKFHKQITDLVHADVVLTTYSVLASEIYFVQDIKRPNLRGKQKSVPPKSPLSEIYWWRVCLDEAQMVDSGTSQAAKVAQLLARVNSWAVSGTPFKRHVEDLGGLLAFLHCEPYSNTKIWARVDKNLFRDIFSKIAIRHTKAKIHQELRLPEQRRHVVSIPFTVFEERQYEELFEKMCTECGFDVCGNSLPDSTHDITLMQNWLRRLRQLCLHVRVGNANRKMLGNSSPLRTLEEVLASAISLLRTRIWNAQRTVIHAIVRQGHIHAFNNSDPDRAKKSHHEYEKALNLAELLVAECRHSDVWLKGELTQDDDSAQNHDHSEKTAHGLSHELRSALEVEHLCRFYLATARFQMGEVPELPQEVKDRYHAEELQQYASAKAIRQELLTENRQLAEETMSRVQSNQLEEIPEALVPRKLNSIDTLRHVDGLETIYKFLNRQKALLDEWRQRAVVVLSKPLVDTEREGVEDTGEEYETSTKDQDALYSLFDILRAICAQRRRLITGIVNTLVEHELQMALKRAKDEHEESCEGEGAKLFLGLMEAWDGVKPDKEIFAESLVFKRDVLRSLSQQLEMELFALRGRSDASRLSARSSLAKSLMDSVSEAFDQQLKALSALDKELDLFRQCMNHRLEYYRRLQAISDTVAPYKETADDALDVEGMDGAITEQMLGEQELSKLEERHRFYSNQQMNLTEAISCPICMDSFEQGVLTPCGHHLCKDCAKSWFSPQHLKCPVCRHPIMSLRALQDIYTRPEIVETEDHHTTAGAEAGPLAGASKPSGPGGIYSEINKLALDEIKSVDLPVSYGTKVDWIGRHLIWLRDKEPGVQVVVCSQFREFLETFEHALDKFGISHTALWNHRGVDKFKHDRDIQCFLLDTKSNSSGLNLVNATHIILCEPLVNPSLELQAIARVHRIGQMKPTTVWMMLIADTVEHSVYNLSVGRRLEHIANGKKELKVSEQAAMEVADSMVLAGGPTNTLIVRAKRQEGELVTDKDVWTCLFGKGRRGPRGDDSEDDYETQRLLRATAAEMRELNGNV